MGRFLFICLGGALGTGARYLVATGMARAFGPDFPRGTIVINAVGSFLIALVIQISTSTSVISPGARVFLATGVLGGFTTYSSFNYETLAFFDQGAWVLGLLNLGITVFGCLVAGTLGFWVARWMGA